MTIRIFTYWFYFECRGNSNWSLTSCLYRYSCQTKNEQTNRLSKKEIMLHREVKAIHYVHNTWKKYKNNSSQNFFLANFCVLFPQFWYLCVVFKYFTSFYVPWRWQPVSRMPTFFSCMTTNIWITYMYPGNLLLVAGGQSLRLTATFAVKMSKTTQNQRRNLPNDKCLFFGFWRHLLFFQV